MELTEIFNDWTADDTIASVLPLPDGTWAVIDIVNAYWTNQGKQNEWSGDLYFVTPLTVEQAGIGNDLRDLPFRAYLAHQKTVPAFSLFGTDRRAMYDELAGRAQKAVTATLTFQPYAGSNE